MSTYVKNYPDNISPQFRKSGPAATAMPCLSCPPNEEMQAIIFDGTQLVIVQGWQWKSNIDMKEFFQPVSTYAEYEITIDQNATKIISYGPLGDINGAVNYICIFPQYHKTSIDSQTEWKMKWRYQGESDSAWKGLGRILMLSGTEDFKILPVEIFNSAPDTVELKILIGS